MATRINVRIFSDVRLHRDGLATLLSDRPSIALLGSHRLADALFVLNTMVTDVALIDAPRLGDFSVVGAMRCSGATLRIIAIGIRETASEVLAFAAAGVDAYVRRDAAIGDTVSTIERLARGGKDLSHQLSRALTACQPEAQERSVSQLTSRELQVADLMNRGLANKEIARHLRIEPCTAKNHVRNIMLKLRVHRRGEAVAKLRTLIGERFEVRMGSPDH
jgi:DNA-binding NarL/FixJ family response regulator